MSGISEVILIDLDNGDVIKADHYRLMDYGIPEGYVDVEEITTEKWIAALNKALKNE